MFASLREPPPRGSPQESILMRFVLKKEEVEHARLRALAQAIIEKDKGKEVFDDYMKVAFPWLENQKGRDADVHRRILMDEVKRGGLAIKPLWEDTKMRSRLKTKVVERSAPAREKSPAEMNRLYAKLGKVIPV
jgi:hypothetical protein